MRHRKLRTRFGRQPGHRKATLTSMAKAVLVHQRIRTTHVRAKVAKRLVEKLITSARVNTLASRRKVFALLRDDTLVSKLFKEIAPRFNGINGGYTRIIPYDFRKGDGAQMVFLELTRKSEEVKPKKEKHAKKPETKKPETEKPKTKEHTHAAPELEPKVKEEKVIEDVKKEKAKDEMRKVKDKKNLFKSVKGFFRRRTNM